MAEINKFLDALEETRETRYEDVDTSNSVSDFKAQYEDYMYEYADNLY